MIRFQQSKSCIKYLFFKNHLNGLLIQKRQLSENSVGLSYYSITPINSNQNSSNSSPVLIFHGLFGSKNNWKSISKSIAAKTGRSVYSFDLRNHGLSPHTSGVDSTLEGMSNDIKLFMDQNNYEKAALIGHRFDTFSSCYLFILYFRMINAIS